MPDLIALARRSYQAYVDKDRDAIEALIADDFHFTSPLDNRIDRVTYFDRCWPNSETISDFQFVNLIQDEDRVFVTYEGQRANGDRFRNTEILTVRDDRIVEAEVYFGLSSQGVNRLSLAYGLPNSRSSSATDQQYPAIGKAPH